jgi:hypothetical protein
MPNTVQQESIFRMKSSQDFLTTITSKETSTLDRNTELMLLDSNFKTLEFSQQQLAELKDFIVSIYKTREAPKLLDRLLDKINRITLSENKQNSVQDNLKEYRSSLN